MRHITYKELERNYSRIISVGAEYNHLLDDGLMKLGYNAGIYGWNYDIYAVDNDTIIVSGYRPLMRWEDADPQVCKTIAKVAENQPRGYRGKYFAAKLLEK